jgi:hypothetical protein
MLLPFLLIRECSRIPFIGKSMFPWRQVQGRSRKNIDQWKPCFAIPKGGFERLHFFTNDIKVALKLVKLLYRE